MDYNGFSLTYIFLPPCLLRLTWWRIWLGPASIGSDPASPSLPHPSLGCNGVNVPRWRTRSGFNLHSRLLSLFSFTIDFVCPICIQVYILRPRKAKQPYDFCNKYGIYFYLFVFVWLGASCCWWWAVPYSVLFSKVVNEDTISQCLKKSLLRVRKQTAMQIDDREEQDRDVHWGKKK